MGQTIGATRAGTTCAQNAHLSSGWVDSSLHRKHRPYPQVRLAPPMAGIHSPKCLYLLQEPFESCGDMMPDYADRQALDLGKLPTDCLQPKSEKSSLPDRWRTF